METANHIQAKEVQAADGNFLRDGSGSTRAAEPHAPGPDRTHLSPTKPLFASLSITAVMVAWTLFPHAHSRTGTFDAYEMVAAGFALAFLASWWVTVRALLHQDRVHSELVVAFREREKLLEEQELLRTILNNLPDQIYAKDRLGRFILNNTAHAKSLGIESASEMLGKTDFDYFPEHLATQFFADEQALVASGRPILNQDQFIPVYGNPGTHYWVSASKVLWRDAQGNIIGTAGITRDINAARVAVDALRRSEEQLRESTLQLERSNRELQDFAYVASHDLQEPLRKIVVFSERLKEMCQSNLTPQARDYLERVEKAAARMQILINDLLSFSRVTTKAQPLTTVDLSKTAHEVVGDLEARIEMVQGRVDLASLPVIQAEPLQMRQLLQNLIGNALKFRRPEEPPVVKVEARIIPTSTSRIASGVPAESICELTVSDNGIGFDEKYLDRIFNVFQRLHARNEYEGSGMGLAIARKIALYHNGSITAKSRPGHGSTFIVSLPLNQQKEAPHEQ